MNEPTAKKVVKKVPTKVVKTVELTKDSGPDDAVAIFSKIDKLLENREPTPEHEKKVGPLLSTPITVDVINNLNQHPNFITKSSI
jgi:hypothetical protein